MSDDAAFGLAVLLMLAMGAAFLIYLSAQGGESSVARVMADSFRKLRADRAGGVW